MAALIAVAICVVVSVAPMLTGMCWPLMYKWIVPAALGGVVTVIVPVAAVPPTGSDTPAPHTSLAKLLAKNIRNIRLSSLPMPNAASACDCVPMAMGTLGVALELGAASMVPTNSDGWRKTGR